MVLRFRLAADPLALRAGLGRVMAGLAACDIGPAARMDAEIVLAEVLNNIAEHAYAGRGGAIGLAVMLHADGRLGCIVTDAGGPMPAGVHARTAKARPAPEAGLAEGGYGLALIAALAPQVRYRRIGARNWLRLDLLGGEAGSDAVVGKPRSQDRAVHDSPRPVRALSSG